MPQMSQARRVMVDNQIRTFDVTDRDVLAAFDVVPRECFVPDAARALAYLDRKVVVSGANASRALLPPLILARLVQALQPQAGESALDVMGGTGYSAAILAGMGLNVSAIESDSGLTDGATAALASAGASVTVLPADAGISALKGTNAGGKTFDVILINGASEVEPSGFFALLAEGGRLGIVLRRGGASQVAVYVKANGVISPRYAFDAQVAVLPGFAREVGFVF